MVRKLGDIALSTNGAQSVYHVCNWLIQDQSFFRWIKTASVV